MHYSSISSHFSVCRFHFSKSKNIHYCHNFVFLHCQMVVTPPIKLLTMKKIIIISLLLLSLGAKAQDVIVTNSTQVIQAYRIEMGQTNIYYQLNEADTAAIHRIAVCISPSSASTREIRLVSVPVSMLLSELMRLVMDCRIEPKLSGVILLGAICALSAEICLVMSLTSITLMIKFSTNLRTGPELRKDRAGDGNFMAAGVVCCRFLRSPPGEGVQDDQAEKEHR